ncbi:MAG: hypothetical protein POELPBGB_02367 [Bacteroidia bacterium]|nr:hypothetical protein [Bacteroidia bacterium]
MAFIRKHPFFVLYFIIVVFLFPGVYYKSGYRFFGELFLHLFSFIAIYFLLQKFLPAFSVPVKFGLPEKAEFIIPYLPNVALFSVSFFIIFHFYHIGFVPLVETAQSDNVVDIALIRQHVTTYSSTWVNYLRSFIMRAVIPFFVVYSCITQKKQWFIAWTVVGIIYSLNLMQKSYIVMTFVPLGLYFFLNRKYLKSFAIMMIPVIGVYFLMIITRPSKVTAEDEKVEMTTTETLNKSSKNLISRLMVVPGKTVGDWFLLIPDEYPFLNGCGYRFARIFGCEFTEYSKVFYPRLYPQYAEKGLKGTVNVATFMYEYSNFGKTGLVLAALIVSLLFLFIQKLFDQDFVWLAVFNFFPALMLSSTSFTTLLFSGGWGLTILLFFIFRSRLITTAK